MTTIGLLHPGEMGASVGASGRTSGHRVLWSSQGRGADTARRATAAGLQDAGTVAALVGASDVVLSRGSVIVRDGQFSGRKGHGRFIKRAPADYARLA